MTNAAVDVALRTRFEDGATPALNRAAQRAEQAQRRVAGATEEASAQQRRSYEKTSRAREDLAGQSEQRIRRELEQTEAAYNKAAAAAKLGAGVQAGALDAARNKVQVLRAELERLQAVQQATQQPTPGNPGKPGPAVPPLRPERYAPPTMPTTPTAPTTPSTPPAQPASRQRSTYERDSQARELLGVRSEQRIQREIAATEAAYNRLASSGRLSADAQARALDATRQRVTALTNEMGKLTREQQKQQELAKQSERGSKVLQVGGAAVAAGAAGAYALRAPTQHAMAVDERLAHLANTAYRERDVRGKRLGMDTMRDAVDSSVNRYGGTRDTATGALEALMASGAMTANEALKTLPTLVKFGTAANADPTQLAQIGIRAMQTFKVAAQDMPNVLNMALAAGQAGGFELKDMAKWLPQQMAAATMSGMSGREGFAKLAALNQAAAITAGTKDEAGNNVVNLLGKINGSDTAKDAQKLGVNLPKYLQDRRARGVDSVDAFGELVSRTVEGRDDYKALQKKLAAAKGDADKRDVLEGMATIAQGAGIGKLIQDRQALMALLGMMNNKAYMGQVLTEVRANDRADGGAVAGNFDLVSGTGAFKARRRAENVQAAQDRALGGGGDAMGAVNSGVADLAAKFPVLTGSAVMATGAIAAMAGAASLAAAALRSGGVAGAAGAAGGVAGGAAAGGAITRAAGRAAPYLMQGGKLLLRGGAAAAAAGLGGMAVDAVTDEGSAANRYGGSAMTGAAAGAAVGSLIPVVGTLVGAGVGALGGLAVQGIRDMLSQAEPPRMQGEIKVSVSDDRVRVSQSMSATGMDATLSSGTGSVWTGAPL